MRSFGDTAFDSDGPEHSNSKAQGPAPNPGAPGQPLETQPHLLLVGSRATSNPAGPVLRSSAEVVASRVAASAAELRTRCHSPPLEYLPEVHSSDFSTTLL